MSIPVFEVDEVFLAIDKSNPPQLHVSAFGKVSSSGWKAAALQPYIYIAPPADGILDIAFVATPPGGLSMPVIMPIAADISVTLLPWIKGVRVRAKTNSLERLLDDQSSHRELALATLD